MATRGRKTKLTPELLDKLEKALAGGNYVETACAYVGISHSVFYHWMAEARKPKAKKIYLDFLQGLHRLYIHPLPTLLTFSFPPHLSQVL